MTIGERIKNRRTELGLTADEVAEQLGKSRATVYRYESGEIEKMPTTVLEPLANVLKTTPAYLMGWDDDPIRYEETEENLNAPSDVNEYFNGDAKKIYDFMKAQEQDAMQYHFEKDLPEEIIILNRAAKKMTPEKRQKLLDVARTIFEEEFDD